MSTLENSELANNSTTGYDPQITSDSFPSENLEKTDYVSDLMLTEDTLNSVNLDILQQIFCQYQGIYEILKIVRAEHDEDAFSILEHEGCPLCPFKGDSKNAGPCALLNCKSKVCNHVFHIECILKNMQSILTPDDLSITVSKLHNLSFVNLLPFYSFDYLYENAIKSPKLYKISLKVSHIISNLTSLQIEWNDPTNSHIEPNFNHEFLLLPLNKYVIADDSETDQSINLPMFRARRGKISFSCTNTITEQTWEHECNYDIFLAEDSFLMVFTDKLSQNSLTLAIKQETFSPSITVFSLLFVKYDFFSNTQSTPMIHLTSPPFSSAIQQSPDEISASPHYMEASPFFLQPGAYESPVNPMTPIFKVPSESSIIEQIEKNRGHKSPNKISHNGKVFDFFRLSSPSNTLTLPSSHSPSCLRSDIPLSPSRITMPNDNDFMNFSCASDIQEAYPNFASTFFSLNSLDPKPMETLNPTLKSKDSDSRSGLSNSFNNSGFRHTEAEKDSFGADYDGVQKCFSENFGISKNSQENSHVNHQPKAPKDIKEKGLNSSAAENSKLVNEAESEKQKQKTQNARDVQKTPMPKKPTQKSKSRTKFSKNKKTSESQTQTLSWKNAFDSSHSLPNTVFSGLIRSQSSSPGSVPKPKTSKAKSKKKTDNRDKEGLFADKRGSQSGVKSDAKTEEKTDEKTSERMAGRKGRERRNAEINEWVLKERLMVPTVHRETAGKVFSPKNKKTQPLESVSVKEDNYEKKQVATLLYNISIGAPINKPVDEILRTLDKNLFQLSKSQYGSRFIQDNLTSEELFPVFFEQLMPHAVELMTDNFGHYAFEGLFEASNEEQRLVLLLEVGKDIAHVACHKQGSFSLQSIMEHISTQSLVLVLSKALEMQIHNISVSCSGHYVILRFLSRYNFPQSHFISDSIAKDIVKYATDHYGLRVVKSLLDTGSDEDLYHLYEAIIENTNLLVQDQFGNYIIQHSLEVGPQSLKEQIKQKMDGRFMSYAKQKFSSNVVEKCLKLSNDYWKSKIVRELISNPSDLINDKFGNYCLQTALMNSNKELTIEFSNAIYPHLNCLRENVKNKWIKLIENANLKHNNTNFNVRSKFAV